MDEKLNLSPDPCNYDEQIRMSCLKCAIYVYEAQCHSGKWISTPLELAQVFYDWVTSVKEKQPEQKI